jgi:uncharacterized protein GlcG (DUF336 family)
VTLTLKEARTIIDGAAAKAAELGQKVAIAVLDATGRVISLDQTDGAKLNRDKLATGKAYAAVLLEQRTSDAKDLYDKNPTRYLSLLAMFPGQLYISFGGGVPLEADGGIVGAIGVAGASHGLDDQICEAGIAAWQA